MCSQSLAVSLFLLVPQWCRCCYIWCCLRGPLKQGSPTSRPWTGTSQEAGCTAEGELHVIQLNHPKTNPHPPTPPWSVEKLSSMTLVPGAEEVGNHCCRVPRTMLGSHVSLLLYLCRLQRATYFSHFCMHAFYQCNFPPSFFNRGRVYFSILWIWVGHISYFGQRVFSKCNQRIEKGLSFEIYLLAALRKTKPTVRWEPALAF